MPSSARTSKNKRGPSPPPPVAADVRDKLVLLLVAGVAPDQVREVAVTKLGVAAAVAAAAVEQAQKSIVLAADVDRRRELGMSIHRINQIYKTSMEMADTKVALAAQRELNRLLGLHDADRIAEDAAAAVAGESPEARELAAVAAHLMPLQLAPARHPLSEHARIAADRVRRSAKPAK